MSARSLRALAALAWRDTRHSRRRLLLFVSAISIGVAALVAIDSYSANVVRSIRLQSRGLLGADLSISAREPFPAPIDSLFDSLRTEGVALARSTSFASMAIVPGRPGTRLVQVRAIAPHAPFYGKIETDPPGRWSELQSGANALVDGSLLVALDAHVGDSLALGFARFAIIGTLRNVPGDVSVASAMGPRVYIPDSHLAATRLLGFGSRAEYEMLLKVPPTLDPAAFVRSHRSLFDDTHVRARTVQSTEQSLTQSIDQLNRFLGVVGLIALLLGGIGVASAIHAYMSEKLDEVAVFRCFGATSGQVLGIFLLEAVALGMVGAAIGAALGVALQFALPRVLGDFIPVDVQPVLEPKALATGFATGIWVAALFALVPVLGVRRVSPLQVLRRDATPMATRPLLRDAPRLLALLALAASVVLIAIARATRVRVGVGMSVGIALALGLLWLSALVVTRGARRALRDHWPFVVRQGIANLYRPANQTRAVVLALGFGAFLLSTLYLVHGNLLRQLSLTGSASKSNLAFFDVQPDQAPRLDSLLRATRAPVLREVPIVPMRITTINGKPTTELIRGRPSWAVRREYRSSYRDTLVTSEKLVAGRWWSSGDTGIAQVSLERDIATELGVHLGDTITWDVQGVRVPTRVTSLREVNWARFEPNFFVIFQPGPLQGAPRTEVLLTRVDDANARARLQRAAVDRFPNISTIDLSLIQEAVERILTKVSLAVRFMALFSIGTGVLVLVSAVASSRRQRIREGVLLKTLGATRAQIGRIMLAEYAVLGVMGSVAGMLLSVGGAWAIMHWIFELPFVPAVPALLLIALGMALLTIAIGLSAGRDVFAETPMAALREA